VTSQPPIGVPHDAAAAERGMGLYDAIVNGQHDAALDHIEQAARARDKLDWRGVPRRLPAGIESAAVQVQIREGYYSRAGAYDDSMRLILEAVHNRRAVLHNGQVRAKVDQLKANPPTVKAGDRVVVRADAPLRDPVLLGKTATVTRPLKANTEVRFESDQALGKFAGKLVRVPAWALEVVIDPAKIAIVTTDEGDAPSSGAVRDADGRLRVRHPDGRLGWAQLGPITWDDER